MILKAIFIIPIIKIRILCSISISNMTNSNFKNNIKVKIKNCFR